MYWIFDKKNAEMWYAIYMQKEMATEVAELAVSEALENILEVVSNADQNIEAAIETGISAGNDSIQEDEMTFWSSIVGREVALGLVTPELTSAIGENVSFQNLI